MIRKKKMTKARDKAGRFKTNGKPKPAGNTKAIPQEVLRNGQRIHDIVVNASMARSALFKQFTDPRRNIYDECGYPDVGQLTIEDYKNMYDREAIPRRVVQVLPRESWQVPPSVFEDNDAENTTAFEQSLEVISDSLTDNSKFQSNEGNPVWEYLLRVDSLSGIGRYGVLLLGIDDGKELSEPAEPRKGAKLIFLRVFDESLARIVRTELDVTNPRFGKPVEYSLSFDIPDNINLFGREAALTTKQVHWTRIIHVADNLGSSEILGESRQQAVFNRLIDLQKLYAGSAEMYWRGAFPGLSFESHPQTGGDVEIDIPATRDMVEQYMNSLQRYLVTSGMSVNSIAPQVVDPTPQINIQIEAICIEKGIPKRIFTGSERGELASDQDKRTWNGRVTSRNNGYITPRIIVPFIDRLIALGILSEPASYNVVWKDLNSLTELEKAEVAFKQAEAIEKYVVGGVENLMHPVDFFTKILGFTDEDATEIFDKARAVDENELLTIPDTEITEPVILGETKTS